MWLACRAYVRDVARGVLLALESADSAGHVFNLCEDRTYSMRMWSRMILDAAGSTAELVRVADDVLPEDLKPTGTMSQHIVVSARQSTAASGWKAASSFRWPPNSARSTCKCLTAGMSSGSRLPRWTISTSWPEPASSSTMARPIKRVPPKTMTLN